MKRKFLILTLCFTIIFSSINYKKSYADGGIISLPVLAIVSTLAVGTGIALNNIDDIYDIGRIFYDYVQSNNKITWDVVKTTFESAKVVNGMISVDRNILDICKDFFNSFFDFKGESVSSVGTFCGIPILKGVDYKNFNKYSHLAMSLYDGTKIGNIDTARINSEGFMELGTSFVQSLPLSDVGGYKIFIDGKSVYSKIYYFYKNNGSWQFYGSGTFNLLYSGVKGSYVNIPYNGTYDWGSNVNDNVNDLPLPIPGNLGDLIGKSPSDIWSGSYDSGLVGNGNLSIPGVDNPSIGIGGVTSFPNVSVENPPTDIPDVENPPVGVIPPFPSFGDSLDFSPMYLTNINEKFPFSLPWDIGRLIEKFDVEPKAPIFKVPIVTSDIELDLTIFDEWANIVRFFILIGFALSLILISTKLLG